MARYLLADNPVKYWQPDGTLVDGFIPGQGAWCNGYGYAAVGCLGVANTRSIGWLQTDGTYCRVTEHDSFTLVFRDDAYLRQVVSERQGGAVAFRTTLTSRLFDMLYCYNEFNLAASVYGLYSGVIHLDETQEGLLFCIDDGNHWRMARMEGVGLFPTWEYLSDPIFDSNVVAGIPTISHGGGNLYYVCFPPGPYAIFDLESGEILSSDNWIDGFDDDPDIESVSTVYASDLNVFFSLVQLVDKNDSDYNYCRLRIYANEGQPTVLEGPVALQPLEALKLSELEVTLLGAQDDPVEGLYVDWSLSGGGTLLSQQTVTGSDGKATVGYVGPSTVEGPVEITAEVAY